MKKEHSKKRIVYKTECMTTIYLNKFLIVRSTMCSSTQLRLVLNLTRATFQTGQFEMFQNKQNLNPLSSSLHTQRHEEPDDKVENFDSTEDREAGEKAKGAPDQTQGCLNCDLVGGN